MLIPLAQHPGGPGSVAGMCCRELFLTAVGKFYFKVFGGETCVPQRG